MATERALSRPGRARARSGVRQVPAGAGLRRAAVHGLPVVGGAGVVRRRALPPVERHPEQPDPAMGRGDGRGVGLPQAVQQRQRQYPRPPGPAGHLRARFAARHAHGARRRHHGPGRFLQRPEAQLPERRRGGAGRRDMVHGSGVRHPGLLRGPPGRVGEHAGGLSAGRHDRAAGGDGGRHRRAQRARVLARREHALRGRLARHAPPHHPRLRRDRRRHAAREGPGADRRGPGRLPRRVPRRRRRQPLVRLGHG